MKRLIAIVVLAVSTVASAEKVYYVTLKFTQTSYTLNIWQHVKDHANAFSITIPTTKRFYDSVKVGQELTSKFKFATLVINGNLGSRKCIIENKFTKEEGQ